MKRSDWILALSILLLAGAVFGILRLSALSRAKTPDDGWWVAVEIAGKKHAVLPLSEDAEYRLVGKDGGHNLLVIRDGKAWIESADCDNQICVHTVALSRTNSTAAISCLPHRVMIYLTRTAPEEAT